MKNLIRLTVNSCTFPKPLPVISMSDVPMDGKIDFIISGHFFHNWNLKITFEINFSNEIN